MCIIYIFISCAYEYTYISEHAYTMCVCVCSKYIRIRNLIVQNKINIKVG